MKYVWYLRFFLLFSLFLAGGCNSSKVSSPNVPAHHTPSGFQNNHLPPERMTKDFSKLWRRFWDRVPQQPASLKQIRPRIEFLRNNRTETTLTWLGHSTFLWQHNGINLITDPHLSQRASPVDFIGPKRINPPSIELDELPLIDFVIISHNHYDHLDRKSVLALAKQQREKPPCFLVPLGLKRWFEDIGISENVIELDWWQSEKIGQLNFTAVPVQHWSKRGLFDTNKTLWAGWVVKSPQQKLFFAGDTGYSKDFEEIGKRYGPMDLSLIPIGAYAPRWFMKDMHVNPEEAVKIHLDVKSRQSIGMHWGTFLNLTEEPLLEPPKLLLQELEKRKINPLDFRVLEHGQTIVL